MTGGHQLFLLRASASMTLDAAQATVVDEGEHVQFELLLPTDAAAMSCRIRLGDLLPEKPQGVDLGDLVRWERRPWFDSCRGHVQVSLERNENPDAAPGLDLGQQLAGFPVREAFFATGVGPPATSGHLKSFDCFSSADPQHRSSARLSGPQKFAVSPLYYQQEEVRREGPPLIFVDCCSNVWRRGASIRVYFRHRRWPAGGHRSRDTWHRAHRRPLSTPRRGSVERAPRRVQYLRGAECRRFGRQRSTLNDKDRNPLDEISGAKFGWLRQLDLSVTARNSSCAWAY